MKFNSIDFGFRTRIWSEISIIFMHFQIVLNADALLSQKRLALALTEPVESLLEAGQKDAWASIRKLLNRETQVAVSDFSATIAGFELNQATLDTMTQNLRDCARSLVEKKAREDAGKVLIRMKDR